MLGVPSELDRIKKICKKNKMKNIHIDNPSTGSDRTIPNKS